MLARHRLWLLSLVLLLTLAGSTWGRRIESATLAQGDFLQGMALPFRDWKSTPREITPDERKMLNPDAVLLRQYRSRTGEAVELAVIAGHRKETVHTPAFCMASGGWETVLQREHRLRVADREVAATRSVIVNNGHQLVATYFFTDGEYAAPTLVPFQGVQLLKRLRAQVPMGALVRILVPVHTTRAAAEALADEFAATTLPPVMKSLRSVRFHLQ